MITSNEDDIELSISCKYEGSLNQEQLKAWLMHFNNNNFAYQTPYGVLYQVRVDIIPKEKQ